MLILTLRRALVAGEIAGAILAQVLTAATATAQTGGYPVPPRGRAVPIAAVGVGNPDGNRIVALGPWQRLSGAGDLFTIPVFDAYEGDASGVPAGFCTSGCDQYGWCPSSLPSFRWMSPNYRAPMSTNDMIVAPGFAGAEAVRVQFAWWWAHPAPTHCFIGIFIGIDFHDCPSGSPPVSGELGGVIFDFGPIPGEGGYWYSDIDVRGTSLSWRLPPSGTGTYTIMIGTDYNGGLFTFDTAWGTQPMQWGTGDAEAPPDGRPGSQGPMQWDDWRNADGILEWNECANYNDTHHCPNPSGSMLAFFVAAESPCAANCDGSTLPPILNANDFQCFLNRFAAGDGYANCDGSSTPPALNANDFQCFLNEYAAGCS